MLAGSSLCQHHAWLLTASTRLMFLLDTTPGTQPLESHLRAGPLWHMFTASVLRTLRMADLASDLISVRLLHDQISAQQCALRGADTSARLCHRLLAAMSACVGADLLLSLGLIFFSTALLRSRRRSAQVLHISMHAAGFLCEVGIAAVTLTLLVNAIGEDGGRKHISTSTMMFFGAHRQLEVKSQCRQG